MRRNETFSEKKGRGENKANEEEFRKERVTDGVDVAGGSGRYRRRTDHWVWQENGGP